MSYCHLNIKKLIKFSYRKDWDFDIVGNDDLGYYGWNLLYGDAYDNRHDLQFMYFDATTKEYSHSQRIAGVQNGIIEDIGAIHKLADSMLWFSKVFGGK